MNSSPQISEKNSIRFTGAVYTPLTVSAAIVAFVSKTLVRKKHVRVLEPSVGDGSFLNALLASDFSNDQITCVDVNAAVVALLKCQFANSTAELAFVEGDFIAFANKRIAEKEDAYDLIIGNPPFIKRSNFSEDFKSSLSALGGLAEYPVTQLKNAWVAFLVAAARLLNEAGTLAFVLPYEFLTVAYGQSALNDLTKTFQRIDLFISNEKAFVEIDQDAIVLVAQKKTTQKRGVFITPVRSLQNISEDRSIEIPSRSSIFDNLSLNAFHFDPGTAELLNRLRKATQPLSSFARSAPGIVSGANDFFILKRERAQECGLEQHCLPILKKGSYVGHHPVFTNEHLNQLQQAAPTCMLALSGPKSELPPETQSYLALGEQQDLHKRYKCRHRPHWFEVPIVKPAPAFFFKRCHSHPRLLINEANVYITDTAYGIHPIEPFTARGVVFSFYNSLTMLFAEIEGRFYGGGVLELSPNEFRGLPLIYQEPTSDQFEAFVQAHSRSSDNLEDVLNFGDVWLRDSLALTENEILSLRSAWRKIRAHRLRHGR